MVALSYDFFVVVLSSIGCLVVEPTTNWLVEVREGDVVVISDGFLVVELVLTVVPSVGCSVVVVIIDSVVSTPVASVEVTTLVVTVGRTSLLVVLSTETADVVSPLARVVIDS